MIDEDKYLEDEEISIDFSKYIGSFRKHWKTIVKITCVSFSLGIVVALFTPRKYTVVTKIAPELSPSITNRLSMNSMLGLSNAMLGTTDAVYPMVYPDVIASPDFVAELFATPVSFRYKKEIVDTTLYSFLNDYKQPNPVAFVLGLPGRAISLVSSLFSDKSEYATDETVVDPFCFTKKQDKTAKMISKSIKAEMDKKTMVLTIKVTMSDRYVCATVSQAIADILQNKVKEYRTQKAIDDCEYYEKMLADAHDSYYDAQNVYSRYIDSHQNVSSNSYMVESNRLKNEANLAYQLYTSMSQMYQSAKAKVQHDTPVFTEVLKPTVPYKSSNSKKSITLVVTFLGFIIALGYVLIKYRKEE